VNLGLINILLAVVWSFLVGRLTVGGFLTGFAIGYVVLWVTRPLYGPTTYFRRFWLWLRLIGYFIFELFVSSLRVLWIVVMPLTISRPGIIAVPLDAETDLEITLLANLISLTPGALSLMVSEDRTHLFVHQMVVEDVEEAKKAIKNGLERRILEALR
jgi:multicomponent Na+:H+ antiporter subunit E